MYHTIEFVTPYSVDLGLSRNHRLERLRLVPGTRLKAQLRPYVEETECGPREVADLHFEDGTVGYRVPFARFAFVD